MKRINASAQSSSIHGLPKNVAFSAGQSSWSESRLKDLQARFPEGMSVQQIVDLFIVEGTHLTEATFRKYIQLGLVPRSVRVGRKGKHQGSKGLYPVTAVRQVDAIRRLMHQGFTIEEIQSGFLMLSGGIDSLHKQLDQLIDVVGRVAAPQASEASIRGALTEIRSLAEKLVTQLRALEQALSAKARMSRAAV